MDNETTNATTTTEQTSGAAAGASTADAGKTFTQAEVDALIAARLARATKGMPDKAELAEFRNWKGSQQTEADKLSAAERERDDARNEAEQYKRQLYLLSKGVPADDLDYYAYKIGKMVTQDTDFEAAAEVYLKDHPVSKPQADATQATERKEQPGTPGASGQATQTETGGARFTTKMGSDEEPKTKKDIMAITDRQTRRAMIAAHPELFNIGKEKNNG